MGAPAPTLRFCFSPSCEGDAVRPVLAIVNKKGTPGPRLSPRIVRMRRARLGSAWQNYTAIALQSGIVLLRGQLYQKIPHVQVDIYQKLINVNNAFASFCINANALYEN
jgi:hypothetical protein